MIEKAEVKGIYNYADEIVVVQEVTEEAIIYRPLMDREGWNSKRAHPPRFLRHAVGLNSALVEVRPAIGRKYENLEEQRAYNLGMLHAETGVSLETAKSYAPINFQNWPNAFTAGYWDAFPMGIPAKPIQTVALTTVLRNKDDLYTRPRAYEDIMRQTEREKQVHAESEINPPNENLFGPDVHPDSQLLMALGLWLGGAMCAAAVMILFLGFHQ